MHARSLTPSINLHLLARRRWPTRISSYVLRPTEYVHTAFVRPCPYGGARPRPCPCPVAAPRSAPSGSRSRENTPGGNRHLPHPIKKALRHVLAAPSLAPPQPPSGPLARSRTSPNSRPWVAGRGASCTAAHIRTHTYEQIRTRHAVDGNNPRKYKPNRFFHPLSK